MIITTKDGQSFDTDRDLSAPERHVLQKLFLWKSMARSLQEFREEKDKALSKGWNNLGPISEGRALMAIRKDLEKKLMHRLKGQNSPP